MSSFQLDENGDILLTSNALTLTTDVEAIRQHLQCRFRLFLGEWFLDTTAGVPWFQDILLKRPSFVVVQQILKNVILDTPGVIELTRFNFDFDAELREASLDFQCLSESGFIDFSQIIEVG